MSILGGSFSAGRKPLDLEEEKQLTLKVARGERARAFIESDFWTKDLGPHWKNHQANLAEGALWELPISGSAGIDITSIGLGCVFNGGRKVEIRDTMTQFNIWIEEGEKARKQLEDNAKLRRVQT